MSLRLGSFPDRGALVWFSVIGGIAAWMFHLVLFASIVEFVHTHGWFWVFYAGNAIAILLTLAAGYLSFLLYQRGKDDEGAGTPQGRMRFLGAMGLLVNGANLMLILAEGTYVFFLRPGLGA